ncbi:hypothetical protein EMCRGX_G014676 [Ephydatia muelleri]
MTESLSRLFYLLLATGCTVSLCSRAETIYLYDLRYTAQLSRQDAFENTHLVAILSGIANRNSAVLYTLLTNADEQWKDYLTSPDQWLDGAQFVTIGSISDLVLTFRSLISGVVLYDPVVYATSNVASTAGGVYDALPVCYRPNDAGSLYSVLVGEASELRLPVALNLERFIDSNLCNSTFLAYYVDYYATTVSPSSDYTIMTVSNHDYFASKKAFFFDLDVWGDETPNDDPRQPVGTDRNMLLQVLQSAYVQTKGSSMIHIGGFTPWAFKYTDGHSQHGHGGVETEWESVRVFTSYNAYVDADACCIGAMANAAFYQHFPLPVNMTQNPAPTMQQLMEKGYIDADGKVVPKNYCVFYAGDYDSAAWLYSQLRGLWDDPMRGQVPIGWAIDPELSLRFPVIFPYLYSTRTEADFFIAGDSGSGYLNPSQLLPPRQVSRILKSGGQGLSGQITSEAEDLYTSFSPLGIVLTPSDDPDQSNVHLHGTMPVFHHVSDLPNG